MSKTYQGDGPRHPPGLARPAPLAYRAPRSEPRGASAAGVVQAALAILIGLVMLLLAATLAIAAVSEAAGALAACAALATGGAYLCYRTARYHLSGTNRRRAGAGRSESPPAAPAETYDGNGPLT